MSGYPPWRPIETWDAEPHGEANRVLIACGAIVGEAWFRDPEGANDSWQSGWWWAGTGPGDYHASPVVETNAPPTHWMRLPPPPTSSGERPETLPLPDPDSAGVEPPAPSAPQGRPVETSARGHQPETPTP